MSRRALALGLLCVGLSGCLSPVDIQPVALSGSRDGFEVLPEKLGVALLEDQRPRVQRVGKRPWLIPLIIWNQRWGNYVTSSQHLGGDVRGDVAYALAGALSGSRFGRGRVIEGEDARSPAQHCQESGDLQYVATGEIHHLYGSVRQRAWAFFILTPWVFGILGDNQIGDPVGVARLTLRIHECATGEEIEAKRFVSEDVYPRLSPSQAAQQAFDRLTREVAQLARVPLPEGEEPVSMPEPAPERVLELEPAPEPEPDPEPEGPVMRPL